MSVAKWQPWKVLINGVAKYISVASTEAVDLTNGGNAGYQGQYNNGNTYYVGQIVRVTAVITIGGVSTALGTYGCIKNTTANTGGNQLPQFPEPTSNVYWELICPGLILFGTCQNGSKSMYIPATKAV